MIARIGQKRHMAARLFRFLALAAIVAGTFLAWMHPQILDIANVGWVLGGQDWGPTALGLAAYLQSGSWPGTATPLILAPEGVHLLMMDSNPLLGLLLKPLAPILPAGVQFIGWWLLVSLALHVRFAWLLVRPHAPDFLGAWLGTALLTLLPALYNRYGHINLCAHWLILWALWIFVDRDRSRRWGPWLAVIAVAGLVHSYLLLIVGAIWASAMLRALVSGPPADRRRTAGLTGLVGALAIGLIFLHGLADPPVSTGTYGNFPMALDALINPANPSYSLFLPSTPNGSLGFEGFQYLGAGLLLLIIAALVAAIRAPRPAAPSAGPLRELRWLLPAFAVLTLLAVTNQPVFRGDRILSVPLPQALVDMLDIVRASGRLFWPVAYTMVFAATLIVYRLERRTLILAAALVLQIADMSPMFAAIRPQTARAAEPGTWRTTLDPRWQALVASASAIELQPPDPHRDLRLTEEIGWRAMLACRPMRHMYVSRIPRSAQARIEADRRAFLAGRIDPTRLYILYRGETVPTALRSRVRMLDGIAFIPPETPAPPPTLCG
jgi:hypothetical protein